jgi:hypothetical protein
MRRRLIPLALLAALAAAAPASADTTTILEPPAKSPVTIPGSGVQRGDRLARGQVLVRRLTFAVGGRRRIITLRCPSGTTHAGLGAFEGGRIAFGVVDRGSYIGHRSVRVRVIAPPGTKRGAVVRASIFALCESPSGPTP